MLVVDVVLLVVSSYHTRVYYLWVYTFSYYSRRMDFDGQSAATSGFVSQAWMLGMVYFQHSI